MDDNNFLVYLKHFHPYLYDIEMRVREVQTRRTGYGDVTVNLSVKMNKVDTSDIGEFSKMVYR